MTEEKNKEELTIDGTREIKGGGLHAAELIALLHQERYTLQEAAAVLRVSINTIRARLYEDRELAENGKSKAHFPNAYQMGDTTQPIYIPKADLESYIEKNMRVL